MSAIKSSQHPGSQSLVGTPVTPKQLAEMLVKHYGLHEGRYELVFEYRVGAGPIGSPDGERIPGLMFGIASFSLARSHDDSPAAVDAAIVNPSVAAGKTRSAKRSTRKQ